MSEPAAGDPGPSARGRATGSLDRIFSECTRPGARADHGAATWERVAAEGTYRGISWQVIDRVAPHHDPGRFCRLTDADLVGVDLWPAPPPHDAVDLWLAACEQAAGSGRYTAYLPPGVTAADATAGQVAAAARSGLAAEVTLAAGGSSVICAPRCIAIALARRQHAAEPDGLLPLFGWSGGEVPRMPGSSVSRLLVDHLGREFRAGFNPWVGGPVTVTAAGGRSLGDDRGRRYAHVRDDYNLLGHDGRHYPGGERVEHSFTSARRLASELAGWRYPPPPRSMSDEQRARQPVVSAAQGRLVASADLAGHGEAGAHLDRAARALASGDLPAATGHMAAARLCVGPCGSELTSRIDRQREALGGTPAKVSRLAARRGQAPSPGTRPRRAR